MADTSSNAIWIGANNHDDWELSRPQIFREEARELFLRYFRIKPSDDVLDAGCGSGVLTRFIAKGLEGGTVTGFDISRSSVAYANDRIAREGLAHRAKVVLEDGFCLSFADDSFDAVVSHNYLAVLSDPVAGLKELIRVCRPGGNISVSTTLTSVSHEGQYPVEGIERLYELERKHAQAHGKILTPAALKQSAQWPARRYPRLFSECGLENISITPIGSGFAYDDHYWSDDYRMRKITRDIDREIEIYEEHMRNPLYAQNGFSDEDFGELIGLLRRKQDYLLNSFDAGDSWEWSASLHCIVSGRKRDPGRRERPQP